LNEFDEFIWDQKDWSVISIQPQFNGTIGVECYLLGPAYHETTYYFDPKESIRRIKSAADGNRVREVMGTAEDVRYSNTYERNMP